MDALKEMAVFAHVVEHGGFTAAARALGLEPSSVWLVFAAGPHLAPKIRVFVDYLAGCAAPA